jgi:predicted phosphoribosyltransferase
METKPRGLRVIEPADQIPFGYFADRVMAGEALADFLEAYRGFDNLVLGLPRGGMQVAEALACRLGADLDVFVSRKIRTPGQPELAAGAVAEGGVILWNDDVLNLLALDDEAWRGAADRARWELDGRVRAYRAILPRANVKGRNIVITDDGVATGATLRAAVAAVARQGPASMVLALPGGSRAALEESARLDGVDHVIALIAPESFHAVGQLYGDFAQVSDVAVLHILRRANERRTRHAAAVRSRRAI